jgi:hypothetical protein
MLNVSHSTLVEFYQNQKIRFTIHKNIEGKNMMLGVNGVIVEIDELMFARVKYFCGKDFKRRQLWIFGMRERDFGKLYMTIVNAQNAKTILKIIYNLVLPGTIIYSDLWNAYAHISKYKNTIFLVNLICHKYSYPFI